MSKSTLEDEVLSLNSIYGERTLTAPTTAAEGYETIFTLPSHKSVSLRIFFPSEYPDEPPFVQGTQSIGDDLPKGAGLVIVRTARDTLASVFNAGGPCLYDLSEELGAKLTTALEDAHVSSTANDSIEKLQDGAVSREEVGLTQAERQELDLGPAPAWYASDVITEKKSVFLARSVAVSSVEEAQRCIAHLLATDKRVARATHNISAWRIRRDEGGATYQDFDDDGETAAGGRLLKLLQMMDVWNVVVVVSRWYGGILLGPARFAIINEAARDSIGKWQEGERPSGRGDDAKGGKARKK